MSDIKVSTSVPGIKAFLEKHFPVTILPLEQCKEADYLIADTFDDSQYRFDGVRILYTG